MKKITAVLFLFVCLTGYSQYKYDNVLFKTVYPQDLCAELQKQPGYIFLDVRSAGEYSDTSSSPGYNLGHFHNAININVRELGKRINEIAAYKNTPVFVYCSHSQRSRRASKMLADSGFSKVFNVNGGVTGIRQFPEDACLQQLLETTVPYRIISPAMLCAKLVKDKNKIVLVDVRSDSAYNHLTADAKTNAYGSIDPSIHIPLSEIENNLGKLPKNKEIITIDMYGDDGARAAELLVRKGYKNVSTALEGIDRYLLTDREAIACTKSNYVSPVSYTTVTAAEINRMVPVAKGYVFLDVREQDEYDGKSKDTWKNIGRIQQAEHIPFSVLSQQLNTIEKYKNMRVIVFGLGSNKEVFAAADILSKNGFSGVQVLMGGLFNLRWTAANVKGNTELVNLLSDIPEDNQ